jgi:hypothetical protein
MIPGMKKAVVCIVLTIFSMLLFGCSNETFLRSRPLGYAMVSDDFAAKGSFLYDSQYPYQLNEVNLMLFPLPHRYGEINPVQAAGISSEDVRFVVIEDALSSPAVQRAFVKRLFVGGVIWTARMEGSEVIYQNDEGVDFRSTLSLEANVKGYIEAAESGQIYYLDHEMVMLSGFFSKEVSADSGFPYQIAQMVLIDYAQQPTSMPDLAGYFIEYDSADLTLLFERAYQKRNEAEYKVMEYNKGSDQTVTRKK